MGKGEGEDWEREGRTGRVFIIKYRGRGEMIVAPLWNGRDTWG